MIEVTGLTKRFSKHTVLDRVSFTVKKGEILGFLGANGAGKSTTMNILTGYLSYNEGTVKVGGIEVSENPLEAKRQIGYLPEMPPLYQSMTVDEYLEFVYELKGCNKPKKAHLSHIKELTGLSDMGKRLIGNISKGYRQRVGIAQAIVSDPEILIFDEPTVGLDPMQIVEIRNLITSLGGEHTIILSSHILTEISAVASRVLILHDGKIAKVKTPEYIKDQLEDVTKLRLRLPSEDAELVTVLRAMPSVMTVTPVNDEGVYSIHTSGDARNQIMQTLIKNNASVLEFGVDTPSLEEIFLRFVRGDEN